LGIYGGVFRSGSRGIGANQLRIAIAFLGIRKDFGEGFYCVMALKLIMAVTSLAKKSKHPESSAIQLP
jgi:hypothetical protein